MYNYSSGSVQSSQCIANTFYGAFIRARNVHAGTKKGEVKTLDRQVVDRV